MTKEDATPLEQRALEAYAALTERCRVDEHGFTWFDDRATWAEGAGHGEQLAAHLYTHFYTSGRAVRRATHREVTRDLQPHYDRLAGDDRGWFDGWQITARHPTTVRITDGSIHLSIAPEDVRAATTATQISGHDADAPTADDGPHQVRLPVLRRRMSPGFCVAAATRPAPAEGLVRIYVSIDAAGAPALLAAFLRHQRDLPDVQAKVLSSTSSFDRLDSFVAYLHPSRLTAITALLTEVVRDQAAHLRDASPSLTGVLTPGIALAVEPTGGGSFGTTVCRVLADALVAGDPATIPAALHAAGVRDVEVPTALAASARTWHQAARPSRGPTDGARRDHRISIGEQADDDTPDGLAMARDIADILTATALTVGDEATWLWHPPPLPVGPTTALATVGPDHYGGTAGIGSFLLRMAQVTHSDQHREIGRRALRHTAARLDDGWRHHGMYTGSAGAALALLQAGGEAVGDDAVEHAVVALLEAATPQSGEDNPDLLSGVAGTLLALLRARTFIDDPALSACTVTLRDRLMTMVDADTGGWPGEDGTALTGFSHGAAGVAYVLHQWLETTPDPDAEWLLTRTMAFEDAHFDAAVGNWVDRRPWFADVDDGPRFAQFWCHGSPGIVLARQAIGGDLPPGVDVATMVDTVLTEHGANELGMCHGLTGLVDIADHLTGPNDSRRSALLRRLHARGPVAGWTESRRATLRPGLLLGLAGVGDHLLRAVTADGASPLLP